MNERPEVMASAPITDKVVEALLALTVDERAEVFGRFCTHCGSDDPRCQCWNDE